MMINPRYAILTLALAAFSTAMAQNLHESFEVEGTYVPDYIIRDRVYTLPARENFKLETTPLAYAVKGVPAYFAPSFLNLPPTGWRASRNIFPQKGYLQLDLGSWMQSDLSAGYRFVDNDMTHVGAALQFNSTSLFKPYPDLPAAAEQKRKMYDGTLSLYGDHLFEGVGTLFAEADYRLANFNYYGYCPNVTSAIPASSCQTLDNAHVNAGLRSADSQEGLRWQGEIGFGYFGYRDLFLPSSPTAYDGQKETTLSLDGDLAYRWSNGNEAGLGIDAVSVGYNKTNAIVDPKNYGNIGVNPFYRFTYAGLNLKVGAAVDFTMNSRGFIPTDCFSTVHIAPDIMVSYGKGAFGVVAKIAGGNHLQTLSETSQLDYYQAPFLASTLPLQSPVDASLGLNFGPFSGFGIGFSVRYAVQNNVLQRGLYTAILNGEAPLGGIAGEYADLKGWQLGVDASYQYGSRVEAYFKGYYTPQNGTKGVFNGYDRPRWILNTGLSVNPWSTLKVGLHYEYRGVRTLFANDARWRLKDLTMLGVNASYAVSERVSVNGEINNLLGCKADVLPSLPQGGLNFLMGFSVKF